jgi:ribosomal protein S18 acetylase RimI-like enzyme
MMDFVVKIKAWWAVQAMIASYNHAYQIAHKTSYELNGPIGVTKYGNSHIAPFQFEFQALSSNPRIITEAIHQYPIGEKDKFILNAFHATPSDPELKAKYQSLGYDFIRTGPILTRNLPPKKQRNDITHIQKADTIHKAEFANENLTNEGERISLDTLRDKHIQNFYAEASGNAVGWLQLVTVYPNVGYIQHIYTMSMYRGMKIGSALVERAQVAAVELGYQHMVIVPSDMAIGLAIRLGYSPVVYFTTFRPAEEADDDIE